MTKNKKKLVLVNMQKFPQAAGLATRILITLLTAIAKSLAGISKITGRGSGTSLPGLLVEKYCPWILTALTRDLEQIVLVTGTNGKTTTRALLVHIWEDLGYTVCTNRGGANIMRGLAASLLLNQTWRGQPKAKIAVLEVEEATLPILTKFVLPNSLILTNIFRDQLDAYGEIDQTLNYFSTSIAQITQNFSQIHHFRNHFNQETFTTVTSSTLALPKKNRSQMTLPGRGSDLPVENSEIQTQVKKTKNQFTWSQIFKKPSQQKVGPTAQAKTKTGFQGFFGRQFPKQNIYEDGFDTDNTKITDNLNPAVDQPVNPEIIVDLAPRSLTPSTKVVHSKSLDPSPLPKVSKINKLSLFQNNFSQTTSQESSASGNGQPLIIVNVDDNKLLTCLQNCQLPIVGFGLDTDLANKPIFEETPSKFRPAFQQVYLASSLVVREDFSRFMVNFGDNLAVQTQLPGFFNLYNVMAALTVIAPILGQNAVSAVASFGPVFGRGEVIKLKNNQAQLKLFLVKNPAGFQQVLELIQARSLENSRPPLKTSNQTHQLNLAFLINDKIADGRDLSWLWDVNFESFLASTEVSRIITGGQRGPDMLLRLEMANWPAKLSDNLSTDDLVKEITEATEDWVICATYTAMLDFRAKIGRHAKLKSISSVGY